MFRGRSCVLDGARYVSRAQLFFLLGALFRGRSCFLLGAMFQGRSYFSRAQLFFYWALCLEGGAVFY